jgi:hypothetical protein
VENQHLITVDELRAAGALDVPPSWRKSLAVERDFVPGLFDDDETHEEEQEPAPEDDDESASGQVLP